MDITSTKGFHEMRWYRKRGSSKIETLDMVCNNAEMASPLGKTLRTVGLTLPEGVNVAEDGENTIVDEEWTSFRGIRKGTMWEYIRSCVRMRDVHLA